jgi:hypothetical protein
MAEHAWCRDIPRDEAVRAAEDGRPGPLPTLEECIEHVTERRPVPPGGGGNVTGLRTELVTLEVTHNNPWDINHWAWDYILRLGKRESVRVVEEVHFDDLANMSLERDAAIRERDAALEEAEKATALAKGLEEKRAYFRQGRDDARVECERLNARVAELESQLESVGCRAATAETALESAPSASIWRMLKVGETVEPGDEMTDDMFQPWRDAGPCVGQEVARTRLAFRRRVPSPAASVNSQAILDGSPAASNSSAILTSSPAASGAAGTEPVAWGRKSKATGKITFVTFHAPVCNWSHEDIVPLYDAPQPAKGWLTAEEREAVEYFSEFCDTNIVPDEWSEMSEKLRALLARSSPPEVVLPAPPFDPSNVAYSDWMMCLSAVRSYPAAAGVTVKEVGSE